MGQFVVRTDKLGDPHWFAGSLEASIGHHLVLAEVIFNAWVFETHEEAETLIAEEGWQDTFYVCEIFGAVTSEGDEVIH